jgi:hypothetical protein
MEGLTSSRFGYSFEMKGRRKCRRCSNKIIKLNSVEKKVEEFAINNRTLMRELQAIYRTITVDVIQFASEYSEREDFEFDYRHWRPMTEYRNSVYHYVSQNGMSAMPFKYGSPVLRAIRYPIDTFYVFDESAYICLSRAIDKDFVIDILTYNLWYQIANWSSRYVQLPSGFGNASTGVRYIKDMVYAMLEGEGA